jgi:hypothetical protein
LWDADVDDKGAAVGRGVGNGGDVTLLLKRPLVSAKSEAGRIVSIDLQTRETLRAKVFVDATYEGDLLAAANVFYQVYQMGLYHFLANDPQVPEELRERVKKFGLDPIEFPETGRTNSTSVRGGVWSRTMMVWVMEMRCIGI